MNFDIILQPKQLDLLKKKLLAKNCTFIFLSLADNILELYTNKCLEEENIKDNDKEKVLIMSPNITNQLRWSENEVHVEELLLDHWGSTTTYLPLSKM